MKKFIESILLFIGIAIVASCSKSSDGEATCTYYVGTDSIVYTDPADEVAYDSIIKLCIVSLNLTSYSFTEKGTSENGLPSYAVEVCNVKALNTFMKENPATLTLDAFRSELFNKNRSFFSEKNITAADDIDLHPFNVYLTLWNFTYDYSLHNSKIEIR